MKSDFPISSMHRPQHNPTQLPCTIMGCLRWFKSNSGCTKHIRSFHHDVNSLPMTLRQSPTPLFNGADAPMFDMPVDGMHEVSDDEGGRRRSCSLLFQPVYSAGSQSSPPPSINHSPSPNNDISLNYHPFLDGEFSPHLA